MKIISLKINKLNCCYFATYLLLGIVVCMPSYTPRIMQILKSKFIKSEKHRRWVANNFPCIICKNPEVQVAHIRHLPKGNVGLALKNDAFVIPLCLQHHQEQHTMNEIKFWLKYHINPILVAIKLCTLSECKKVNTLKEEGYFNGNTNYFRILPKDSLQ